MNKAILSALVLIICLLGGIYWKLTEENREEAQERRIEERLKSRVDWDDPEAREDYWEDAARREREFRRRRAGIE